MPDSISKSDDHAAARVLAAFALVLIGALAGFFVGAALPSMQGPASHGEDVMGKALTDLFITDPAGATMMAIAAGWISLHWLRQPSSLVVTLLWIAFGIGADGMRAGDSNTRRDLVEDFHQAPGLIDWMFGKQAGYHLDRMGPQFTLRTA
jgi:hypothetical protein